MGEEYINIPKIRSTTPLIFVPGIMGSQLWEQGQQSRRIWPFWHWTGGEFRFESLKLLVEAHDKVATDVFPDVYSGIILALENMGYTLNHNFWIFPYDWTQSNETSGKQLATFMKERINGKSEKADVVCHSMGGIVTRAAYLLHRAPIRRTICFCVPHLGTPRAFFALKENINIDFFRLPGFIANAIWRKYARRVGDEKTLMKQLKWVCKQLQSVYELLPDRFYLSRHSITAVAYATAMGPDRIPFEKTEAIVGMDTYYNSKYCSFDSTEQRDRVEKAMRFKEKLGKQAFGNSLAIYSSTEETPDCIERFIWMKGRETPMGWRKPTDSGQHGDGVVPTDSAIAICEQAKNVGGTHLGLPNSSCSHIQIAKFLSKP